MCHHPSVAADDVCGAFSWPGGEGRIRAGHSGSTPAAAIQAIRDNEEAAASVGVRVLSTKRVIFVVAAFGAALAGALWLATTITFQPKTYFSVPWTAYMIFMVLVGGLGTFEGPIISAVIFFLVEAFFGADGVWNLIGLGATAHR
jgi:branched-chain amino acid transport system permease protein